MKTNILYFILSLWMAITSFWGCADNFEGITPDMPEVVAPENPGINAQDKNLHFDASGAAMGVTLRAIGSAWKAYPGEECPWLLNISPKEGDAGNNVIGITLSPNESMAERSTFIVVEHKESGDTIHINIKQYTHESKYSRLTDSLSLIAIYKALSQSEEWEYPWDFKKPITTWEGIEFEEINGEQRVVGINIREYNLYGQLPNELGNLRELKSIIIMRAGDIVQSIPTTITSLRKLEEIRINFKEGHAYWDVPENAEDMKSLRVLEIAYLKIAPQFFKNLYKIQSLEVINTRAYEGALPEGISEMTNLKELTLDYTKVTSLPQDLSSLPNLESLNLSNCGKLTSLGDNLGELSKLQALDLSYCYQLKTLPENIGQLQGLTSLNLSGCSALERIPESFSNLTNIATLSLYNCSGLKQLPSQIGNMNKLTSLELNSCSGLTSLPESLGNLTKLTKLDLGNCSSLTSLPESIGNLTDVTEISMSGCEGITSLPESLGSLRNLKKFTFTANHIIPLPSSFGNLTNLEEFDCSKYFPDDASGISGDLSIFKNMSELRILKANYNRFSGDLSVLSQLPNLSKIELAGNQFNGALDLSKILTGHLTSLNLSFNGLSGTLAGITQGTALTELALNDNQITGDLPENIDLCSKLTALDLSNNLITGNLPVALTRLNFWYGTLKLMMNNMSGDIPEEIVNSSKWNMWMPDYYIIPQNPGYGFSGY